MREMKDSGVEWIGEIPKDWDIIQIKKLLAARDGGSWGEEPQEDQFDRICYRVADFDFSRLAIVSDAEFTVRNYTQPIIDKLGLERGDILVEKSGGGEKTPVGRAVFYDKDEPVLFANFIERLRISSESSPRYFFYVWIALYLTGVTYNYIKQTTGIQNLDIKSLVSSVFVPSFDLDLQHHIADYLDTKCTQIDRVIARQQEVIAKFKEYKLLKINEVLANVSENVCHLGFVGNFKNGLNFNSTAEGVNTKFLGVGDFKDQFVINSVDLLSDVITAEPIPSEYLLENNDIVFVRSNGSKELVGRSLMVKDIEVPVSFSGFCIRFRNQRQEILDPNYLLYFFRSPGFRKQLEILSNGSNINNINQVMLSKVEIRFPSLEEQVRIVAFFDIFTAKLDKAISQKEQMISKLTEYKKSLIYEVVTGKREV